MSTTFAVETSSIYDENEPEIIEVAFRSSYIRWTNPLAQLLPDNTKVIPIDNTAQGIYTIGDLKREINKDKE